MDSATRPGQAEEPSLSRTPEYCPKMTVMENLNTSYITLSVVEPQ